MSAKYRSYFHQNCYVQRETKNEIWLGSLPINHKLLQPFFCQFSKKPIIKDVAVWWTVTIGGKVCWNKIVSLFQIIIPFWFWLKYYNFSFRITKNQYLLIHFPLRFMVSYLFLIKLSIHRFIYLTKNAPNSEFFLITLQWIWRKIVN